MTEKPPAAITPKPEDLANGKVISIGNEHWMTSRSDIIEALRTQLVEYARSGAVVFQLSSIEVTAT